ncbi:MAG: cation:proton antiporter [Bacteroidota bacterium]|nr:sodium:proton exchanger [Odoribacter sp.]MDP3642740.1 cation:proton antiporter [Bacteroidota bacterium]
MNYEILKDIVIILALSTFVNFLFTKIRIPTLVGYLLTGIVAGPFLLGIIQSQHEIELMAELGVVILMFTIGMEFSLKHLLKIRRIVFLGGLFQVSITALITIVLGRSYNLDWKGALFIGFLIALSSTAVVLKILQDRSEVTSNYGRTVVGILIFQDIVLIPLLLFTPFLNGNTVNIGSELFALAMKTVLIVAFVYTGNKWFMPKILHWIAMTKNQELFLMSILLICLSIAFLTSQLGITLAFGAFLAGLMVSESEYSDNAFGNLIPFRDTFTSFFFVSIGMLLDLSFVYQNIGIVIITVLLVIGIKFIVGGLVAFLMGHTFRGTILVGIALSQVGEFSFILAKLGVSYQILTNYYFQLFLAVAIITMSVSPLLIQLGNPLATILLKLPLPGFIIKGLFPLQQIEIPKLNNHLVLIGKDSRSINLSVMAKYNKIPYISIVFDPALVRKRQEKGESIIYGDAKNEPILYKAHVDTAKTIVISVGDLIIAMAIVDKVRHLNKHAMILVRTKHVEDIEELYRLGANQVIPEEFETAIDLFERVLSNMLLPQNEIDTTIARIRDDHYGIFYDKKEDERSNILKNIPNIEIVALRVDERSNLTGKTLAESQLRNRCGVTLVALKRNDHLIDHPSSNTRLIGGDIAYILGNSEQIANATNLFNIIL